MIDSGVVKTICRAVEEDEEEDRHAADVAVEGFRNEKKGRHTRRRSAGLLVRLVKSEEEYRAEDVRVGSSEEEEGGRVEGIFEGRFLGNRNDDDAAEPGNVRAWQPPMPRVSSPVKW